MKWISLIFVLALCGCASAPPVVRVGVSGLRDGVDYQIELEYGVGKGTDRCK